LLVFNLLLKIELEMKLKYKIFYWAPRVICILSILFISLFALDAFDPDLTIWQQIGGFLIHMVPSFILLAALLIAWRWELTGGIIFITLGLLLSALLYAHNYRMNQSVGLSLGIVLMMGFPYVLAGILFVLNHKNSKKSSEA
jgi:hypothetical protein